MIEILDSPPHVGAYRVTGQFKGEDYDGRFARAAIVTDKRWLVAVTGVVDRLMPRAEMRTFALAERLIALAWAMEKLDPSLG